MIAPTLLIGLGGTGAKIVLRVSKMVSVEQRDHLGFAVFDTDINELRDIQRDNPFIKIIQTSTKLSVGEYLNIDTHARDSWFPVNAILNSKTLTEGAGQVRAISRLAFDTAIRAGKMEQLHEAIQDLYKLEEGRSEQALRVIIVSSLAGGTGSGLILPVGLYVKNYLATHFRQSANITRGFFILPEVFEQVIKGNAERTSLRSNAYATLRELDAFLMKGDATLPKQFMNSVKIEFPRVGSEGYEEYKLRPYDFCFLFDAQSAEGTKLNSFNQYLDHAANCIYAQSIGPMNKRSNSSEDNTIRLLAEERGRNRYAGAGSSMLIYPVEDVKEFIALNWAKESVSKQWVVFDELYKQQKKRNEAMRNEGISAVDPNPIQSYIDSVESMSKNKDPFAKAITNSCAVMDADGITKVGEKWEIYVNALKNKIIMDESSGQKNLDQQKEQVQTSLGELEDGKDWEIYQNAYRQLDKYRAMIEKRREDASRNIAYALFMAPSESATTDKLSFRLETYMRDETGSFIHPSAVRYFLYKTLELLILEKRRVEFENDQTRLYFANFEVSHFDNPDTETVERVENLADFKKTNSIVGKLTGKSGSKQQELRDAYSTYLVKADDYRSSSILASVLEEGISYVTQMCEAFQHFFATFDSRVADIEKRITDISKKYEHTKGTTARYVCATKVCLTELLGEMSYPGKSIVIDSRLAEEIYNKVRKYALMTKKPQNSTYFHEVFENGILGYYKDSVMSVYSDRVDMDIITALEKEAEIELDRQVREASERKSKFEYDDGTVIAYVEKTINNTKALSCPFIEKPLGMEKQPIYACAFNPCLDRDDESTRTKLVNRALKDSGGIADDDIAKNMVLFYQSFYGLRANELSKFAPPERAVTSERPGGEYFKAYFDLINNVHPSTHRSKSITPHIDRWWHIVTKMPDLDDENQTMMEGRIYAAFFWALIFNFVELYDEGKETKAYRLSVDQLNLTEDSDVLIVSNGTPCDRLYEALDAFAIYPKLVDKTLEKVEDFIMFDANNAVALEEGHLYTYMSSFRVKEYPLGDKNKERSLFDIATLMKRSVKPELYNEEKVVHMLKSIISEIKRYLSYFCSVKELPDEMGKILRRQFELFLENVELENKNLRNFYHDYLFNRTCSLISTAFEELGLHNDAKMVQEKVRELTLTR